MSSYALFFCCMLTYHEHLSLRLCSNLRDTGQLMIDTCIPNNICNVYIFTNIISV